MNRRDFLAVGAALGVAGCATGPTSSARAKVVVVGGGFGGATVARYVRLLSDGQVDVTLVEPDQAFVSCPLSNLVLGGSRSLASLTTPYDALTRVHGVRRVRAMVSGIDPARRIATLDDGSTLPYDKLVLSPGVELQLSSIDGLVAAHDAGIALNAWHAGPETTALRARLEAMPDGGVFAITIPEAPYRCPPGPYERACQVASYFTHAKPRSKVLVLDENADVVSKAALFKGVWASSYPRMVEYRPLHKVVSVDAKRSIVRFEVQDDVVADVLNVLPPMRAGSIAVRTGLATVNGRWCKVDYRTFESTVAPHVHVIGDSVQGAAMMPKSGHMANAQGKVVAAAIVAELRGWEADPTPVLTNVCYSFVDATRAMHVASVHQYSSNTRTYDPVPGSGGVSKAPSTLEGSYGLAWAQAIWQDAVG